MAKRTSMIKSECVDRESRERYWRQHICAFVGSGLPVRRYCSLHGICEGSFYWWRRELMRLDGSTGKAVPVTASFCEVKLAQPVSLVPMCTLEVVTSGGRTVRVYPGFDEKTFSTVVSALEGL